MITAAVTPLGQASGALWSSHAPWVLASLLVAIWVYLRGADALRGRGRRGLVSRWRMAAWFAGLLAVAVALASPIDVLAGSLFSAHMGQHVLLTTVAAPLLAVSMPGVPLRFGLPPRLQSAFDRTQRGVREPRRWSHSAAWPLLAAGLHAAVYWLWHLPGPYEAALRSEAIHLVEHATMFGTALVLWTAIIQTGRRNPLGYGAGIAAVFVTALAHGGLGAVLTFAPHILYGHYLAAAPMLGIDALTDQHLAGVIMWAPGKVIHGTAVLLLAIAWLQTAERRATAREAVRARTA